MEKLAEKAKRLVRGTSTSVLLSIGVHALILLLAGSMVVFSILEKQEQKFVPVNLDRPKMKLNKPRVKVQDSKPRKSSERIMSTRKSSTMPQMQLPAMTGMGSGLGSVGGFEMVADVSQMTLMGGQRSVGNDLVGTFYDLKRTQAGGPVMGMEISTEPALFIAAVNKFFESGWNPETLSQFYQGPRKLYATQFMIPSCASATAPPKFGIGEEIKPCLWLVHYKGKIAYKQGGTFRFCGYGDDLLFVRINGKVVLNASHGDRKSIHDPEFWQSSDPNNRKYPLGNGWARVGDWFTLEPGVPVDMELLTSEIPGGVFTLMLLVEQKGVVYPKNDLGAPILPIFKTMPSPAHLIDEMEYGLIPGQVDLESGPVFNVY